MTQPIIFAVDEETGELRLSADWQKVYGEVDPWSQSALDRSAMAAYYEFSRENLVQTILRHGYVGMGGIEIGCGLGYLTAMLNERVGPTMGIDISPIATMRARQLHPALRFRPGDVTSGDFAPSAAEYVVLGQAWWYVLHDLDRTMANIGACLPSGGDLFITQAFLRSGQKYMPHIRGFTGALDMLLDQPGWTVTEAQFHDRGLIHHDSVIVLRRNMA